MGYTNNVLPSDFHVLTVNYFDDYNYPGAPAIPSTQIEEQDIAFNNGNNKPKGLPTGTWERVGPMATGVTNHEFSYMFYDKYANPIRTYTKNHQGGRTEVDTKFDFSGKVRKTVTKHKRISSSTDLVITDNFSYTLQDRPLQQVQQINNENSQRIFRNFYDELGQLIKKEVGSDAFNNLVPDPPSLQWVDYKYNIRGWLTSINNTKSLYNEPGPTDLFAFQINYTQTEQSYGTSVTPLYNGNIAETLWRSGSDNVLRSYGYKYDAMNRLTNAIYGKPNTTPSITNNYNEWLSYDANGNILTLGRNGISDSHFDLIQIDDLIYEYEDDNSNRLVNVYDDVNNDAGFKKVNNTTNDDFEYDDHGNLIKDRNKEITSITYNHLNLPTKVTFEGTNKNSSYLYTATGQKVQKMVRYQDSLSTTRYINGFQYYDNVLQFFHTPEGYVKNTPELNGDPSFDYVYQYKDHLGNVRLSYTQNPQSGALEILEEAHYYPFGLQHGNYNTHRAKIDRDEALNNEKSLLDTVPPTFAFENRGYNYKFQGQEHQDEFGLNWDSFKFRNYSADLGRFWSIDPLAENFVNNSTYAFSENRVIDGWELEGRERVDMHSQDPNLQDLSPEEKQAYNDAQAEAAGIMFSFVPGIGDAYDIGSSAVNGDKTGVGLGILGILPFGDFAKIVKPISNLIDGVRANKSAKKLDKLLDGAKKERTTSRKLDIFRKEGGLDGANADFDAMNPKGVKDILDGDSNVIGREGTLPDGQTVKVRNKSSDGAPTVEVGKTNTKGNYRKTKEVRYDEQQK